MLRVLVGNGLEFGGRSSTGERGGVDPGGVKRQDRSEAGSDIAIGNCERYALKCRTTDLYQTVGVRVIWKTQKGKCGLHFLWDISFSGNLYTTATS